jgi:hypothetical protein
MDNSGQETSREKDLFEKYTGYTDEQIFEILKNHKDYQELAVDVAVKIAVTRKLINSKQDLLAPEYQQSLSTKRTLFPEVRNEFHRKRLIGSIFRFIFLMSVLPLAYGILNYAKGEINKAEFGIGLAIVWFVLGFLLKKTRNSLIFIPLFILLFSVSVWTGFTIFNSEVFLVIDFVMLIIGTLLPLYLLLYLKKLLQKT